MRRTHNHALTSSLLRAVDKAPDDFVGDLSFEAPTGGINEARATPSEPFRASGHSTFDAAVRALDVDWRYGPFLPGYTVLAHPDPGTAGHFVAMPPPERFRDMAAYRATVAHELVHWTQHPSRVGRPETGWTQFERMLGMIPDGYAQEEATAELGAALLLDALGEAPDVPARAAYVKDWATAVGASDRGVMLAKAAEQAEQAVDWLLARMTTGSRQ